MILAPPVYICDDDECRSIAATHGLGEYKVLFQPFDSCHAYDSLVDETGAALAEMHYRRLRREARRAAPFIVAHECDKQLYWYRRKLLEAFHMYGCLTFLKAVPPRPRNLFKPNFYLTIAEKSGDTIVDVPFDSMLDYGRCFGVPRKSIYRSATLMSKRGTRTRDYNATVDIMKGEDPITSSEGIALMKAVQSDPLTKDVPSYLQEYAVRFYLSGLLNDKAKPLSNSQKRAEKRMLERRAQTFSGDTVAEDAQDEQSQRSESPADSGPEPAKTGPDSQDG